MITFSDKKWIAAAIHFLSNLKIGLLKTFSEQAAAFRRLWKFEYRAAAREIAGKQRASCFAGYFAQKENALLQKKELRH